MIMMFLISSLVLASFPLLSFSHASSIKADNPNLISSYEVILQQEVIFPIGDKLKISPVLNGSNVTSVKELFLNNLEKTPSNQTIKTVDDLLNNRISNGTLELKNGDRLDVACNLNICSVFKPSEAADHVLPMKNMQFFRVGNDTTMYPAILINN